MQNGSQTYNNSILHLQYSMIINSKSRVSYSYSDLKMIEKKRTSILIIDYIYKLAYLHNLHIYIHFLDRF